MKRIVTVAVAAVLLAGLAASAGAAELVVFMTSPQAISGMTSGTSSSTLGAPVLPNPGAGNGATYNVEVWLQINPEGPNFSGNGYTVLFGAGFDIAGENDSVKGTGLNLFRTFNTPPSARRWLSTGGLSRNGSVGGTGYLWQGTTFDYGSTASGINSFFTAVDAANPAAPDAISVDGDLRWKLASFNINIADGGDVVSSTRGIDNFFDVFFELRNNSWGTGNTEPVGDLAWGFEDEGESFFASQSVNPGRRSTHPDLRIEAIPEPATMVLLGLGGLLLRRRRA